MEYKHRIFRIVLPIALIILLIIVNMPYESKSGVKVFTLPGLPRPIARAPVVITSAGQNTDSYIIRDISNQLMIRSFFMPQARSINLRDINTLVFVVGYSSLGMKLQDISYEEEKKRVEELLEEAEKNELKILVVVLGGEQTHEDRTDELLQLIGVHADYLIGLRDSRKESVMTELAKEGDIPLTLVGGVKDISDPFASAFR